MAKLSKRNRSRAERIAKFASRLPELEVSGWDRVEESGARGAGHLRFFVRKKTIAYFLNDHHGDGLVALCVKCTVPEQADLVDGDPDTYYVPPYIGRSGWVGIRLDRSRVDWDTLEALFVQSYRLQAPKTLVKRLDA